MIGRVLRRGGALSYPNRSNFSRTALILGLPLGAFLACELLETYAQQSSEIPFLLAVALATWFCGPLFGLAALVLATLFFVYFFLPPYLSFAIANKAAALQLAVFLAGNGAIFVFLRRFFQVEAELADSQKKHRNLSELLPFGGWTSDAAGNMTDLSQSFLNTFRTTMEECRGIGWTKLLAEEQRAQVAIDWQRCVRQGYFWDYEYRMYAPDGETYAVLSRGVPVHGPQGEVRNWIGIHLDITERQRSAEQQIQQARDLERFNSELEQIAYVSAHDLQEPLRTIASYLQLLSRRYKGKLDADADTFIDYAVEGVARLQTLLQDLMLLQQVGKEGRPKHMCRLSDIVAKALRELKLQIDENSAQVRYSSLPQVACNQPELVKLFQNLIENALRYCRKDISPEIAIEAERQETEWLICVRDNGLGIEPEYLQRIFDVFQRLHPRGEHPGTGIGLAVCKKIVEIHGGRIWAESTPGEGSAFFFTLPAKV